MKEIILGLLLIVTLSSFVMAESEIGMSFVVGEIKADSGDYVSGGFCNDYGSYVFGVLVALVVVGYFILRARNKKAHKKKRVSKKKVGKKK